MLLQKQLAVGLRTLFRGVEGFSRRLLYRRRAFYLAYAKSEEIVSQLATQ